MSAKIDPALTGETISHYHVLEKLGQGGMGVVYKAEDTKLDRHVALKFLPAHLLGDEDVRKRFEREAKAAAALHHPNICPVYEIDESDGKSFIVMAFIEGESLDKKIARGPVKLDQASDIGQQVANGLAAAHKRGVVHRDVKPENIIVDDSGHVTIMDFGLAQLTEASRLTRTDETVGTVAYMSPEQTDGSGTDHRADVWSLGVLLYEMVTGQQPFKGDYDKAVMYSILNEEPEPITALRTGVPVELEVFVGKCLAKQSDQRYQTADELAVDLRTLSEKLQPARSTTLTVRQAAVPNVSPARAPTSKLPWVLLSLSLAALVGLAVVRVQEPSSPGALRRFAVEPEPTIDFRRSQGGVAIAPDGSRIACTTGESGGLRIRDLATSQSRAMVDTQGAFLPFWSPDSSSIGFASGSSLEKGLS